MSKKQYDFSGWATVHGIKCSDGVTIIKDAFKDNDGNTVPLVWNHDHSDVSNVLGHALLENREKGVYAYCSFNDTDTGKKAKELVRHGDLDSLSIYANKLTRKGNDVTHGSIRELSLVLAGANPLAHIDFVLQQSSVSEDEAVIFNGENELEIVIPAEPEDEQKPTTDTNPTATTTVEGKPEGQNPVQQDPKPNNTAEVQHSNDENETIQDVFNTLSEKQKNAFYMMLGQLFEKSVEPKGKANAGEVQHKDGAEETLQDVFDTFSEKQKAVAYAIIAEAIEEESNKEGKNTTMKQNAFENTITGQDKEGKDVVLNHSELDKIFEDLRGGIRGGSLRAVFKDVCIAHGMTNLDTFFPDAKAVGAPKVVEEDTSWVGKVMGSVKHLPFSRIKSTYIDITGEQARALGYIKGNKKVEEVIEAFKRSTDPQTIYKLQKFDRDDMIDITDFDVVTWIKAEMRAKLEAELARAILVGDGRSSESQDKISTSHIRPVAVDHDVYTIKIHLGEKTAKQYAETLDDDAVLAMIDYKGGGNTKAFIRVDVVARLLLRKDTNGYRVYKSMSELASAMGVNEIVKVPASIMGGKVAIIVDLGADYCVGSDKGGQVSLFDDFDIDYNKMAYLIETRCSGALVTPSSAIVFDNENAPTASSAN